MKVALISPEYYDVAHFGVKRKEIPPFGVLYLAAIVEEMGHEVVIHRVSNESYCLDLSEFDVAGFSVSSSVVYTLIQKVREHSTIREGTLLLAGGIHATIYPEDVINELNVDIICIGESEHTLREILAEIKTKNFSNVAGILYRDGCNLIRTEPRSLIDNLDVLPFPARHLMPIEDIVMSDRLSDSPLKVAHLLCSRGCPYHCHFCANQEHTIRYRSGKNIKSELEYLIKEFNIEGFCITDDNFIVEKKRIIEISKEITPLSLKWSSLSRVNTVDEDILQAIKDSGCLELKYGIESGSQRILNSMNKGITVAQIHNAIEMTHKIGIKIKAFIIHGFPGENLESTNETISLLESLKDKIDRISIFRFVPLPGSYVYKNPGEFKLILPDNFDDIFIYNNSKKWWGDDAEQNELTDAYNMLENYVKINWGKF